MKAALILLLLSAAAAGGGYLYVTHRMHARGYDRDSICGHRMMNGFGEYLAFLSFPVPASGEGADDKNKAAMEKYQQSVAERSNADQSDFADVLNVASSAKRMKLITANTLCFPENVQVQQIDLYAEYSKDLDARMKQDPNTCKANYEADVIAFLTRKFPCH